MKKKWLLAMIAPAVLGVVGLFGCTGGPTTLNAPGLKVNLGSLEGVSANGQGQVQATPDIARLSIGIQAQAATVADAQSQATRAMNDLMNVLIGQGIQKKDIQTQNFNITQLTRYDQARQQSVITGYQVTNTVVAKIRTIDNVGPIIDASAKAGGDLTRVQGVSFGVDDPTPYLNQAREKAMADAKAKADQMASLAGVSLGKPVSISESSYQPPVPVPIMRSAAPATDGQTPISPGEMSITVNVQIVYPIVG